MGHAAQPGPLQAPATQPGPQQAPTAQPGPLPTPTAQPGPLPAPAATAQAAAAPSGATHNQAAAQDSFPKGLFTTGGPLAGLPLPKVPVPASERGQAGQEEEELDVAVLVSPDCVAVASSSG